MKFIITARRIEHYQMIIEADTHVEAEEIANSDHDCINNLWKHNGDEYIIIDVNEITSRSIGTILDSLGYVKISPTREKLYCWREFAVVEGENYPKLIIPCKHNNWDPHWADEKQAREWKEKIAPDENWILCTMITTPI